MTPEGEKKILICPYGHIRKSTVSELYEFLALCPHLLIQLATVALGFALIHKLGWHAILRS